MSEYKKPKAVVGKDSTGGKGVGGKLMLIVENHKPSNRVPDCGGKRPPRKSKLLLG